MKYNGLRGNGLIVLRAADPNVNFVEHDSMDEAQGFTALEMANHPGVYVIYQPIAIIRPKLTADIVVEAVKMPARRLHAGGGK